jgi:hypothetical protein
MCLDASLRSVNNDRLAGFATMRHVQYVQREHGATFRFGTECPPYNLHQTQAGSFGSSLSSVTG